MVKRLQTVMNYCEYEFCAREIGKYLEETIENF